MIWLALAAAAALGLALLGNLVRYERLAPEAHPSLRRFPSAGAPASTSNTQRAAKVILIHASNTQDGGIINATIFYATSLLAIGYNVEVWTASQGLARRARSLGIPVFCHRWLQNAGIALIHPALIAKALRSRRSALAAVHQGEKLWLFGRVWLFGVQESVVFHNERIGQRRLFRRWLALSERHHVALENLIRERKIARKVRKIRNGPLPDASHIRQRPAQPIVTFGSISNFGQKKAIDVLVKAFAETVRRGHDVRLLLAGDGRQRKQCEALAMDLDVWERIEWMGWQSDTRAFYERIDLFCLPSRNEPFGIVTTEAMQAGLPVIATDTFGPRDIVVPGKAGWLVPVDDVTAMADAMEDSIKDPEKSASYGEAGYAYYEEHYSPPAAGKVLASALELPQA
jgi:glycosyltransferase involved in cell wall biosynthesis